MKTLLDTNVLIYAIDQQSEFHAIAQNLVYDDQSAHCLCSISLSEAYSVLTRKKAYALSPREALRILQWYQTKFPVLYPNAESRQLLNYFITAYQPKSHDIFDMEIASVALANGVRNIITRNIKDFSSIAEVSAVWPDVSGT